MVATKKRQFKILPIHHLNTDDELLKHPNVIPVPEVFVPSYTSVKPYIIKYGSRYSGKSWDEAKRQLLKAAGGPSGEQYYRGVFARMTQKAARQSQFQLFQDTMNRYPLLGNQFKVRDTDMKITHKKTGNYIQGGSFEDSESLMSVPDLTDCWLEEPLNRKKSLIRKQFEDISGTLRNDKGIIPQMCMTFNPINKDNFIHEDFFVKKAYDTLFIKANWYDNPYCPEDRIDYLMNMKKLNPERYKVDGEGLFGNTLTGYEYYGMYNNGVHKRRHKLQPLPIHITFDFNVNPYMTAIVNQVYYDRELGVVVFQAIKEYCIAPPYSTIKHTCAAILKDWTAHIRKYGCYIYGDPTARNRTVIAEARDLKKNIIKHMKGYASHTNMRFSNSARRHLSTDNKIGRYDLFQMLFGGEIKATYFIDPEGCPHLIDDYENVQIDPNGGKAKPKTKEAGNTFEKYGHTSDAQDYFIGWQVAYQFKL